MERKVRVHRKKGRKEGKEIEIGGEKVKESVRGSRSPAFRINTPTAVASLGIRWVARLFSLFLSLSFYLSSSLCLSISFSFSSHFPPLLPINAYIGESLIRFSIFLPTTFDFFSPSLIDQFIYMFYILYISSLSFISLSFFFFTDRKQSDIKRVIKNQWNKFNTYL